MTSRSPATSRSTGALILTGILGTLGACLAITGEIDLAVAALLITAVGVAFVVLKNLTASEAAIEEQPYKRRLPGKRKKLERSGVKAVPFDAAKNRQALAEKGILAIDPDTMAPPVFDETSDPKRVADSAA